LYTDVDALSALLLRDVLRQQTPPSNGSAEASASGNRLKKFMAQLRFAAVAVISICPGATLTSEMSNSIGVTVEHLM